MAQQKTDRSKAQAAKAAEWMLNHDSSWTLESLYMSSSDFDRNSPAADRKPS